MLFPWAADFAAKLGIPRLVLFHGISNFAACVGERVRLYEPRKKVSQRFALPDFTGEEAEQIRRRVKKLREIAWEAVKENMNRAIAPTNGRAQKHEILFTGRTSVKMMFSEDTNLKQKEENWNQLIKEKGLELINMEAKQSEEAVLLFCCLESTAFQPSFFNSYCILEFISHTCKMAFRVKSSGYFGVSNARTELWRCSKSIGTVPQHGAIFDIRVADGYGTTWWSKDGTKLGTLLSTPNLSACNAGFLVKSTDWGNNCYGTSIGLVVSLHILMISYGKDIIRREANMSRYRLSGNMEEFLKILIYDDAKIASILSLKAATDQGPIARRQVLVHIATVK
ncbi:hypothetical protein SADUNF_Sadunf17G0013200 [Salix dunnii]|uniref:Uncharacterized protein n=1 Tax=Salix dunnii TaxID=1413687 RepID=A0A835J263_9ROSI|nr:hypothetical protein SADUNF_Sadunf17G0013200 [Salix dunnii]